MRDWVSSPYLTCVRLQHASSSLPTAHSCGPRVVRVSLWEEPMVGIPCKCVACPPRYHPHLHGPADHSCHRQQEGAQVTGEPGLTPHSGLQHHFRQQVHLCKHLLLRCRSGAAEAIPFLFKLHFSGEKASRELNSLNVLGTGLH